MTPARSLLDSLRRRGVELTRDGSRLRCHAQRGTVPPSDLRLIRDNAPQLLAELRRSTAADLVRGAKLVAVHSRPIGFELDSQTFGRFVVAMDEHAERELRRDPGGGLPVLTLREVAELRRSTDAMILAALERGVAGGGLQ